MSENLIQMDINNNNDLSSELTLKEKKKQKKNGKITKRKNIRCIIIISILCLLFLGFGEIFYFKFSQKNKDDDFNKYPHISLLQSEEENLNYGVISQISKKYKTVSIVGLSKNAGKTTALNYFIEEAMDEGLMLGITSTGRDGETQDLVTGTEKPRVFLDEGTLVAIPEDLYGAGDAGLEIIRKTPYSTTFGFVLICKVKEAGYVQVAGPSINADQKRLCKDMLDLGCDLIIIDGAIDRKTIGSPDTSDAVIISTGAVLSRRMKTVIEETQHIVNLYTLPQLEQGPVRDVIEEHKNEDKIMLLDEKGNYEVLNVKSSFGSSKIINDAIKEETKYLFIPGAFTKSVIADMNTKKLKRIQFVLKDPTKIFLNVKDWWELKRKGFTLKVLKNIEIAAITINPWSPLGYSFDNRVFYEEMKKAIPGIFIIDVRKS